MASIGMNILTFSVIISVVAGAIVALGGLGVLPVGGVIAPDPVDTGALFSSVVSPGDSADTTAPTSDSWAAIRSWSFMGILISGFSVISPPFGFLLQFGLAGNPVILVAIGVVEAIRGYYSALGLIEFWKGQELS